MGSGRRGRSALALVAAVLVGSLAGCLQAEEPVPGTRGSADAPAPLAFRVVPASISCGNCWEPTVAVSGVLAVASNAVSGTLVVTDVEGRSLEEVPEPPPAPGMLPGSGRGDETVQADAHGHIYFSALVCDASVCGPSGVQVARSDDGGRTWDVNVFLSLATMAEPAFGADRQWLAFGEADVVYLTYSQWLPRTGMWIARSDDGGATWGSWARAVPIEESKLAASPGPLAASGDLVAIPHLASSGEPVAPGLLVRLALSEDGGRTFRQVVVHDATDGGVLQWPAAAVDYAGRLHVGWATPDGDVLVSSSEDRGASWSAPGRWNGGGGAAHLPPHLVARGRNLTAAWIASEGTGQSVWVARQGADGSVPEVATLVTDAISQAERTTDFAYFDAADDGRAVVVWSDGDELWLAFEAQ